MKLRWKWIILAIAVLIPVTWSLYQVRTYYAITEEIKPYQIYHHQDDTIRIAFVGDSWAYHHQEHPCKIDSFLSYSIQRPVIIMSEGIPGATSKDIYAAFFNHPSIRSVLKSGPDYCILSAGINDANIKIGKDSYQQHIQLILDFLLHNHIVPVILEIPDYNIERVYNRSTAMQKLRRRFSMLVTGSSLDCRTEYRQALLSMIEQNHYQKNVILVKAESWNPSGFKDPRNLYLDDGIHLNYEGYSILDHHIVQAIIKDFHSKNCI